MVKNVQNMKWKKEIFMYDVERSLEIAFYLFKKVRYSNLLFLIMQFGLCFVGFYIKVLICICQFENFKNVICQNVLVYVIFNKI